MIYRYIVVHLSQTGNACSGVMHMVVLSVAVHPEEAAFADKLKASYKPVLGSRMSHILQVQLHG